MKSPRNRTANSAGCSVTVEGRLDWSLRGFLSRERCVPHKTFGCDGTRDEMWVAQGCRGIFSYKSARSQWSSQLSCGDQCEANSTCHCGKHRVIWGSATPSTEAHVAMVFGNGIHACAAAVNGASLAALDPQRARTVLAWDVSEETIRILSHSWLVQHIESPPGGPRGVKSAILDAALPPTNGQPMRRLTRAMYWE